MFGVSFRPSAFGTSRRETLLVGLLIDGVNKAVDPAVTKRHVQSLGVHHRLFAGTLFEKTNPHFIRCRVVLLHPGLKRGGGRKGFGRGLIHSGPV